MKEETEQKVRDYLRCLHDIKIASMDFHYYAIMIERHKVFIQSQKTIIQRLQNDRDKLFFWQRKQKDEIDNTILNINNIIDCYKQEITMYMDKFSENKVFLFKSFERRKCMKNDAKDNPELYHRIRAIERD